MKERFMTNQQLLNELVSLTCDLVAMPSTADKPDQLQATIDYVERYVQGVPGVYTQRGEDEGKPHLVVTLRETRRPKVFLNAHLDVVPALPEQFHPQVRNGRIYGRATQDMKGSAAVLLRLLKDLAALPERPDVGFMFVSDEEIGGENGTGYLARQCWGCDFFLAAEPTDLDICYAHKGVAWIEIHLTGQPAHGSRPWDGENALTALREGLVAMERRYPTPDEEAWVTTVVPTVVQGGSASNRLPESVTLTLDVRHVPEEQIDAVVAALRGCFPGGDVRLIRNGAPLATDPNDAYIQRLAAHITSITGQPVRRYREHFATDARFYSEMSIPSICFGPIGAGLHSNEEWVDIASLGQLYEALRRFVIEG
jgi:succinyl-diaminopimelate desuccinylase